MDFAIPNQTAQQQAAHDFQSWFRENVPKSIIMQSSSPWPMNQQLEGFDQLLIKLNDYRVFNYENWTIGTQSNVTFAIYDQIFRFDLLVNYPVEFFSAVFGKGGLLAADTVTGDPDSWEMRPYLAKDFTRSPDGLTYIFNLHPNLTWHDGVPLNATDIKWNYDVCLDPDAQLILFTSCRTHEDFTQFFNGSDNIQVLNATSIEFQLSEYHPFAEYDLFQIPFGLFQLPWHVLKEVPYDQWQSHYMFNPNATHGLLGYGPYTFKSFTNTSINPFVTVERWTDYDNDSFGTVSPSVDEIHFTRLSDPDSLG